MRNVAPDTAGHRRQIDVGRRGFMVTTLAAGFALAFQPVAATTITTDATNLLVAEVEIPVSDGRIPAYKAQPVGAGPFPVLLVIEELYGVHEHIKDMCRRFAKQGYMAIAPELFARLGNLAAMTDVNEIAKLAQRAPDKTAMSDLDATVAWAAKNGGDTTRLSITGFCSGGRMVWMYAAHNPDLKAAVAWYGPLGGPPSEEKPTHPLDVAADIKVPVLGLYGGQDKVISQDQIAEMKARLLRAGNAQCEFVVYPEAGHAFNADYRPSYNEAAAKDGMQRALAWLHSHGAG
jgi:carboxymethylenebutenolidase